MAEAHGPAQKRQWVRLTRVCNQRCLFCLDRDAQDGSMLPLERIREELQAGRSQGLTRVVLSGGEPTIHPRFLEAVALARGLGYEHVQIITNGRRLCYPGFLKAALAAGLREITFSLHGHNAALHDRLTRVPGSFVQALTALRAALAAPGLIVSVDVVVNRLNLPVLRELLDFYVGLGVREFDLLGLVPFSDAWRHREELFCDLSEPANLAALGRALELSRRPGLHIWTNRLRAGLLEGFESLIQPPEKIHDEVRGRRKVFARFLATGSMKCAGPNCRFCFLQDFCADLGVLVKEGRLGPKEGPLCLPDAAPPRGELWADGPIDLDEFAEFFIRSRFFAKGSGCARCELSGRCAGAPVGELRERGFSQLQPGAAAQPDARSS